MKLGKILFFLLIAGMFVGCVTNIAIKSNVEGADVYIDGERVGSTPCVTKVSSYAWYDPEVVLKKEGYKDLVTRFNLEPRMGNLIAGVLLLNFLPISLPCLLTCHGPARDNYFKMDEK